MQGNEEIGSRSAGPELASVIAERVRNARTARRWSLDELAARSGVSRRMLVNIEQQATNPTIATLLRITDALGIGLPSLVDMESSPRLHVTAAGNAPVLWKGAHGGRASLVAAVNTPAVVELWDWTLMPGETHDSEPHRAGTHELLHVVEGRVELRVGSRTESLPIGGSATFSADVAHSYSNPPEAREPCRFALSVYEPGPDAHAPSSSRLRS